MPLLVIVSGISGVLWNTLVVVLMGGKVADSFAPDWIIPGILTGILMGLFLLWTSRRFPDHDVLGSIATYYLAMIVYWLLIVIVSRIDLCARHHGWTDFGLRDHLMLIVWFLLYGTLYGLVLIPVTWVNRYLIGRMFGA